MNYNGNTLRWGISIIKIYTTLKYTEEIFQKQYDTLSWKYICKEEEITVHVSLKWTKINWIENKEVTYYHATRGLY
jgi:hypothetical protein